MADKKAFQDKLRSAAGKMQADGVDPKEIQAFIDRKKDEYRSKYGEGKTEDAPQTDASVASGTESKSEDTSSASDREIATLQAKAIVAQHSVPGMPPAAVDKVAALLSGTLDMFSNITKVPRQATYGIMSSAYELFDPEAVDTPEEKAALMASIEMVSGFQGGSRALESLGDKAGDLAETFSEATTKHDKTIGQQFAQGEILGAIDQTVQQIAFTAPSVAAAFTGAGGVSILGASAFGGKFEEEYEKDPTQAGSKLFLVSGAAAGIEIVSESVTAGIAGRAKALLTGKGKKAAQKYLLGAFESVAAQANVEGWSEVAATVGNKYLDNLAYGREVDLGELVRESFDSYLLGAVIGGGIAKVGTAGAPGSFERDAVDIKTTPDATKEANNNDANKINTIAKEQKNAPEGAQETLEAAKQKLEDSIDDRAIEVSDVNDTLQESDDVDAWEHYINNHNDIKNNDKLLEDPNTSEQTKEIIQEENQRLKDENAETYEDAKAKTTNTSEAISNLNYWSQSDTSGYTEEQLETQSKDVVKTQEKLDKKLEKESQDDAPVSKSTKKEIKRGNVQLEVDGKKRKYVRSPKKLETEDRSGEQLLEDLETVDKSGVVNNARIENGQIVGEDTKTGLTIATRPHDYGTIFTSWANAMNRTSGYNITPDAVAAVQNAEQSVEPAESYVDESVAPGVNEAIDKYNRVQKIVKSFAALRNKQGEITGEIPAISDQHRAISSLIAPLRSVAKANQKLNQIDKKIAAEKAARPTLTAEGVQTGGADPAKIADLEAQRDLAILDVQEAINNIPDDVEIPEVQFSPEARLKEDREAYEAQQIQKLENELQNTKVNKKNAKKIASIKRRIRALRDQGVSPDGFSNTQVKRYIADLKRGRKTTTKLSEADVTKFVKGKRTPKKVNDMAVKLARFTMSRAGVSNFGVLGTDVIQEANLAAIDALNKFDGSTPQELLSKVSNAVKTRTAAFRRASKFMPLPVNIQTRANKIRKIEERLLTKLERLPNNQEIADATGIPLDQVKEIKEAVFINQALATPETVIAQDGEQQSVLDLVVDISRESNNNKSLTGALLSNQDIARIDKLINSGLSARDVVNQALKGRNLKEFADKFDAIVKDPTKAEYIVDAVEAPSASPAYKKVKGKVLDILAIEAQERAYSGYKDNAYTIPARFIPTLSEVQDGPTYTGGTGVSPVNLNVDESFSTPNTPIGKVADKIIKLYEQIDNVHEYGNLDDLKQDNTSDLDVLDNSEFGGQDNLTDAQFDELTDTLESWLDNKKQGLIVHNDLSKAPGKPIQLNIGLENNPIDNIGGIIEELRKNPKVTLGSTEQVNGEYLGEVERTVVVDAKYDGTPAQFKKYIEELSAGLTQEAIGTTFDGTGDLVYDPKFKGEKYTFDPEFFVAPSKSYPNLSIESGNNEFSKSVTTGNPFIQAISSTLQKNWPNINILMSAKRWENFTSQLAIPIPPTVRGLQTANTVALNPHRVGLDTPIHEFSHIWLRGLQQTNPKLWLRGVELLKGSPYMKIVYDNPMYRQYLRDGDKARFWEEVMANAVGKRGAELFTQQKDISKWDGFISKLGDWVKQKLGVSSTKDYQDLTLEDWLDIAVHGTVSNTSTVVPAQTASKPSYDLGAAGELILGATVLGQIATIAGFTLADVFAKNSSRDVKLRSIRNLLDTAINNSKGKDGVISVLENTKKALSDKSKIDQLTDEDLDVLISQIRDKGGLNFNIEETDNNIKSISRIEKLLNDPNTYKTSGPYKYSKIDADTREFLRGQKKKFAEKAHTYTPEQLGALEQNLINVIKASRKVVQGKRSDIKGDRVNTSNAAAGIIETVAGVDPNNLNTNDIDVLAKENTSFMHRFKTRGIGGVIADVLAPSSNDDFAGLLNRLLIGKDSKGRAEAETVIGDTLLQPLKEANYNYIKDKQGMLKSYTGAIEALAKATGQNVKGARKFLGNQSGITIGKSNITNSQVAMIYNYIKDPRLHKQLSKGGIDLSKMTEILDYVDNNPEFKTFINSIPNIFAGFKGKLNAKLDQHGYRTVADPIISSETTPETKGILNRIYEGNIPAEAPYTPFFGEGAETLDITQEMFEGGKDDFYTVMSGRLKQRTYGGNVDFKGKDLESMFQSYVNGPVRTASFLDFAKNASAFFNSKNLKAAKASLGESWGKSMEDSLRRIVTGSHNRTNSPEAVTALDKWLNRSIANIMFLNPRSAMLQLVSTANFAIGDPIGYAKSAADIKATTEAFNIIRNSDFLKERAEGKTDVVVDELFKQKGGSGFTRGIDRLGQQGYFLTKKADGFAIALGGAPYLAAKIKEYNGDVEKAMQDFIQKANESQQSTNPEKLGRDQTSPVGRYLLAFTNATQQFNRIMATSAREISVGKDRGKNFRKISYIMGTQIALFSFLQKAMASAFDFDDEEDKEKWGDYLTGILDTIATSTGILGSVFATATQSAKHLLRGVGDDGKLAPGTDQKIINELINISPAVATKVRNIKNALKEPYRQSEGFVDVDARAARVAHAIQLSGIPTERALRIFEQFNDLGANDLYVLEKAVRLLGWSRYDLGQQLPKEQTRRGRTLQTRAREERSNNRKRTR